VSRASGARPGIQGDTTADRFCRVTLGPGSSLALRARSSGTRRRRCRARSLLAGSIRATRRCGTHDVKQRSLLRSRGAFVRAGFGLALSGVAAASPLPLPTLRRASPPSPRRQRPVRPLMRGGRSADRRTRLFCRSRVRGATTAPLRRGTVPLRAGPLSALHRGDFRPGTHAAVSGSGTPEPPVTCPRQATRPGGRDPGPPGLRFAPQPSDATPRSACRIVSGDAPQERGCECLITASIRSQ
jgi:hypothetical protein